MSSCAGRGKHGFLWESYEGDAPHATKHLVREAFESATDTAAIPAAVLRARLPETLRISQEREHELNEETDPDKIEAVLQQFRDFVALCVCKEKETGAQVEILASY